MTEEWRSVEGYEGLYEVSDLGRVRSLPRPRTRGGVLKPSLRNSGYLFVKLSRNGESRSQDIHRLVATAFHEVTGVLVRHMNADKSDNRAANLRWGSYADNAQDALRQGRNFEHNKTHCPSGHRYDEANTYWTTRGSRFCRACGQARDAVRYARQSAERMS